MTEAFVPLSPATLFRGGSAPLASLVAAPALTAPAFDPLKTPADHQAHSADACAKPSVVLQRNGDAVTGIRVQCGCGQVIELNCLY